MFQAKAKKTLQQATEQYINSISNAWYGEAFHRQKKLEKLDKIISRIERNGKAKETDYSENIEMAKKKGLKVPEKVV